MKFTYLLINFFTILVPLVRSAEPKLQFYKKWKYYFPASFFTAVVFITLDYYQTKLGVWSFNDKYILGYRILGLPLEELLFFFTVPYSCTFIYEAISGFFDQRIKEGNEKVFVWILSALSFIASFFLYNRLYTFSVLFLAGVVFPVATVFLTGNKLKKFFITFLISLLPMAIVNGLLTALPVVIYDNSQNLGIRIGSIPVEDFLYGAILLVMNIGLYEMERSRRAVPAGPSV